MRNRDTFRKQNREILLCEASCFSQLIYRQEGKRVEVRKGEETGKENSRGDSQNGSRMMCIDVSSSYVWNLRQLKVEEWQRGNYLIKDSHTMDEIDCNSSDFRD
jgi:hypothetical protein